MISKEKLKNLVNIIRDKIKFDKKIDLSDTKILYLKDFKTKDFWLALINCGGFCDFGKNYSSKKKAYKIRILNLPFFNMPIEDALKHEILHIKLKHLEEQKAEKLHCYNILKNKKFEDGVKEYMK